MQNKLKQDECETLLENWKMQKVWDIFAKYIKNKTGKYLVLCANVVHMYEMISQVTM